MSIDVGGAAGASGGTGTLNIETGAFVTTDAAGQLVVHTDGTLNINGGSIAFGTFFPFGVGKVNFNSGTIQQLTGLTGDEPTLTALLGPTHELGVGRTLLGSGADAGLSTDLDVNGGRLQGVAIGDGGALIVFSPITSSVILRVRGGGAVQFATGITLGTDTRSFVEDGTINPGFGATLTQQGELHLSENSRVLGGTLQNTGLVAGSGFIDADLVNQSAGQVRVVAGERLLFAGSPNTNDGLIDVNGGELEFASAALTNSTASPSTGLIAARNATLRFSGGLTNNGALTFTSGVSEVFGDVTNTNALTTPGRIVVSGGAQANFYDDVTNSGSIQVSAAGALASTAVFLGSFSGNGVSGGGQVFLEGDVRPGFSAGTMAFGGDVSFGPLAALEIELAGTAPGTEHDRMTVADSIALGGTLEATLLDGFLPQAGDTFEIIAAAGGISGTFTDEQLPTLAGGLFFDVLYAPTTVSLFAAGVLGDYNYNGIVDAADYTVWRDTLGQSGTGLAADGDGDTMITMLDYNVWKSNFGQTAGGGAGATSYLAPGDSPGANYAVPEPTALVLAIAAWMMTVIRRSART